MSTSHSPAPHSPSPSTPISSTPIVSPKPTISTKVKATNLFSNDGSFLERFQRIKKEEDDKKAAEEIATRKRNFDDRFKKRGKRPAASSVDAPDSGASTESGSSAKKAKSETPLTQYEKEVKGYQSRSLKDQGIGVRPLVK